MTTKNPFDFSDLSDLPEELAKKLNTETTDNAKVYADVVRKGAEAGYAELEINQIIAAATRMGLEPPTQQTVRNYLNKAVELGLVNKPSRQTYGIGAVNVEAPAEKAKGKGKAEDAGVTAAADPAVTSDPLADLGV